MSGCDEPPPPSARRSTPPRNSHTSPAEGVKVIRFPVLIAILLLVASLPASARVRLFDVPGGMRSDHFTATVNGHPAQVAHAAANYYYLSMDLKGSAHITIQAPADGYWDRGVEVQPWRLNIRPAVHGRTISFTVRDAVKLSITRPGDHLGGAEMFFLFANAPEVNVPQAATGNLRYYGPGEHHENIDARSGDNIYIAAGAVVYGALNLWQVSDVHVFGRGVIVYDGPQDPDHDQGWMHRKDWHCIVMDEAHRISVEGVTCIVRSRTWMIQMRNSHGVRFDNVKVIGGSPGNANQDGMDWLGGGDTVINDCFIRAADDIFAMYGNWDGYDDEALVRPGDDVGNITVEHSVVSTSISNVVRVGWPRKVFNSRGFVMRDTDVIHMGMGGCGIPFALMEIWADPGGKGEHADYRFDDIRLENWYSLVQLQQPNPSIRDVHFTNISSLASPPLAASSLAGDVSRVSFDNVQLDGQTAASAADLPLAVRDGAAEPEFPGSTPAVGVTYTAGLLRPHQKVTFSAEPAPGITRWEWLFGDGTHASGRTVHHRFPDDRGTLQDGSGSYRVLLKTTDAAGHIAWNHTAVVIGNSLLTSSAETAGAPGLRSRYASPGTQMSDSGAVVATISAGVQDRVGTVELEGYIRVPRDGGYTFTLLANESASLWIDGQAAVRAPKPWPNVCSTPGYATQSATGGLLLAAGLHRMKVQASHSAGANALALRWEGPGVPPAEVPPVALSHASITGGGR